MAGALRGRVAIVTGASSGIGMAVARGFAAEGARIVLAARRVDKLEALAGELAAGGADILVRPTDVRDEAAVAGLFAEAERFGAVDLLINNAGTTMKTPTPDCSLDEWHRVIDLNLTAAFLCAREAMRVMIPRRRGRIITVGSVSAQMPRPDGIAYATSKFGLDGMTHSLALDGRPHGITASIVHPGLAISELGGQDAAAAPGPDRMAAESVAKVITLMAAMPDEANLLNATILPIAQPYLGRG